MYVEDQVRQAKTQEREQLMTRRWELFCRLLPTGYQLATKVAERGQLDLDINPGELSHAIATSTLKTVDTCIEIFEESTNGNHNQ